MDACTRACICTYAHSTHVFMHIYLHMCTYTNKHIDIQTHGHTYVHGAVTHTHIYIESPEFHILSSHLRTHPLRQTYRQLLALPDTPKRMCACECSHKHTCTSSALTHRFSLCMCLHNCTCFSYLAHSDAPV